MSQHYGIIQRSTLGPVLFLIYIINLGRVGLRGGKLFLYVDDTDHVFEGDGWDEVCAVAERSLQA